MQGKLLLRGGEAKGTRADADALNAIDLAAFYEADTEVARLRQVQGFLKYRDIQQPWDLQTSLYKALESFGPMATLINDTMKEARPVDTLGGDLFSGGVESDETARAVTTLIVLPGIMMVMLRGYVHHPLTDD